MAFFSNHSNSAENMFQLIYDTYRVRVFDYLARKINDRDDTRDVMQNVFVHLWLYKDSLGGPNTENIIFKTCNQEISIFFEQKKKQPLTTGTPNLEVQDQSIEQLQTKLEIEDRLQAIQLNIDLLPTVRKQILTMNKLEGITQETIATQLQLSKKAVKKQLSKAILFLRENQNNS